MKLQTVWTVVSAILLGMVFFGLLMGAALGFVTLNIRVSPDFAWFPLPVTLLLVGRLLGGGAPPAVDRLTFLLLIGTMAVNTLVAISEARWKSIWVVLSSPWPRSFSGCTRTMRTSS